MASIEHCLFCFETLSSRLEKRSSLSLSQVQTLWAEYSSTLSAPAKLLNPTLSHLTPSGASTPSSTSTSSSLDPLTATTTPQSSNPSLPSYDPSPLFVTWNTVSARDDSHSLRGCIGTFEALPLSSGLSSYALTSALSDHRFSPISLSELPTLSVSVTLLTDFEDAAGPLDWEVGVHGLKISFRDGGRRYGACYLPDVAVEQGWEKEESVVSLMRKGGWRGRESGWKEVEMEVVRFQGHAESLGYEEFKAWREWVGKRG